MGDAGSVAGGAVVPRGGVYALVQSPIRRVIDRYVWMFDEWGDIGIQDLFQEVYLSVEAAYPSYDPERSSLDSWVWMIGYRKMVEMARTRRRKQRHEEAAARENPEVRLPEGETHEVSTLPEDLADWCGQIYTSAKYASRSKKAVRRGPRSFNVAQAVSVTLFMHRLNLTFRQCSDLLRKRKDLAIAMRFRLPPSPSWLAKAEKVTRDMAGDRVTLKRRDSRGGLTERPPPWLGAPRKRFRRFRRRRGLAA
jgi:hypothetical protein